MVGEAFLKLAEGDTALKAGTGAATRVHEIAEVMGTAFSKMLRAEETGDPVSDLYEALC